MAEHDVDRFLSGLSEKLASRARHVAVFLGAGASRACGLPDVAGLTEHIKEALHAEKLASFEALLEDRNLEQVLSRLRRIEALIADSSDTVDGLSADEAKELDREICRIVIDKLSSRDVDLEPMYSIASWLARADYHRPVEIFTVNYDVLLETALESLQVPYFDGFVGTFRAQFRADLVESAGSVAGSGFDSDSIPSFFIRLWKLHGSIHWTWVEGKTRKVVRLGEPAPSGESAAIYPSDAKYDESRRVPFLVLQDRFRRSLDEPESLTIISGYAFGDEHLNESIFEAARRRPRSEFLAFFYSGIPSSIADFATSNPNFQAVTRDEAIIGGFRECWAEPTDCPKEFWDGGLLLGDFAKLSKFVARSSPAENEVERRIAEVLAKVVETDA